MRDSVAAASVAVEEGRSRRVVFRTKEGGGREGLPVCGSQRRAVSSPLSFFFSFFFPSFFSTCIVKTDQTPVSLPYPLFTLCFRRYIRSWKEQCDLIVPFHFISDTIASVIFIESCVYHLSLCRGDGIYRESIPFVLLRIKRCTLGNRSVDIWLRISFFLFVNPNNFFFFFYVMTGNKEYWNVLFEEQHFSFERKTRGKMRAEG